MKPNNPRTNWILLLATIGTTFITGYFMLPPEAGLDPIIGGAIFSAAILTVLGVHEMGHKLTANKKKIDATSPYFIPGPPPLGTLGAVIMQKSLPANRDALFDIGANGPLAGFIIAIVFSAVGFTLLIPTTIAAGEGLNLIPISWLLLMPALSGLNLIPKLIPPNNGWFLHPIAYAGWAGMVVTMLNLLPAAMLDGGHVARSAVSDKLRWVLTFASVLVLFLSGTTFIVMAFLIVFMSMFKHPGPLDDVSGLSRNRKLLTIGFGSCFYSSFPRKRVVLICILVKHKNNNVYYCSFALAQCRGLETNHEGYDYTGFLFALRGSVAFDSRTHVSGQLVLRADRPRNSGLCERFERGV